MKLSPLIFSLLCTYSAASFAANPSQPPIDGGESKPVKLKKLVPLEPLREEEYSQTKNLVLALFGPIAKKIYYYYAPHKNFDMDYPFAPLSRIEATHHEGLSCYRRIPKWGDEQFRCNIAFHPVEEQGNIRNVPPYTFGLRPEFADNKLTRITLTLKVEGESRIRNLIQASCPRLSAGDFAGSNFPCAYQVDHDQVSDAYFPDDIFPQGVAVGWGVVQE